MWVEITKTGKYKYCERYTDPMTGKLKKISVTLDSNKKTAQRAAEEALKERIAILTAGFSSSKDVTFGALCKAYTAYQKDTTKEQTAESNERKLKIVQSLLGPDTLVSSLNAPYVRRRLSADRPETYNERLARFKAVMRWAYREEMVQDISYLDKLIKAKDKTTKEKDKDKYLEKDELQQLLTAMKVDDWRLLTLFLALSGLRIGEAIALEESDIDFHERWIHVNKTYVIPSGKLSTTKTETSTRNVSMQDELYDCCLEITQRKWKIYQITGKRSEQFFPNSNGGYLSYFAYNKYFRKNTDKILGRKLTPHSLRHTHVALLAENGVPLEVISRRLGHADSAVTRDVYFHVTKKLAQKDADIIKNIKIV